MAFEDYTAYCSNFDRLNQRVSDFIEQKKYIDSWKNKYAEQFKKMVQKKAFYGI